MPHESAPAPSILDQIWELLVADLRGKPEFDESIVGRIQGLASAGRLEQWEAVLEALSDPAGQ